MERRLGALMGVCAGALASAAAPLDSLEFPTIRKVEAEVFEELQRNKDGTVFVIVVLRGDGKEREAMEAWPSPPLVAALQNRVLGRLAPGEFSVAYMYRNIPALAGRITASGLNKFAADPEVIAVGPDGRAEAQLDVSVPFINANDVHTLGYTGDGVTVAVIDTGINTGHPDLADDLAPGAWHFLDEGATQGPGAEDDHGHGSNVSGIVTSRGVVSSVGVAPDTDILAVKVLDASGSGFFSDITAGIDYVVSVRENYARLCAISMSLGTTTTFLACPCNNNTTFNMALQASLQGARDVGIITFAATGNRGFCGSMSSPGCLSAVEAVAAVYDQDLGREPDVGTYQSKLGASYSACFDATTAPDKITCFSNRNACNSLAAPGRLITAPTLGAGVSSDTGTSQATPHVTGVAALLAERCPFATQLTPDEIVSALISTGVPTTDPCGTMPNPKRVDALAAILSVTGCCISAAECTDANPCTTDTCDAALGCQNVNNDDACDDGDACTVTDACSGGACNGTPIVVLFADVAPPGGDGLIDINDILCVLDDFTDPASCSGNGDLIPCGGGGDGIDINDILAELDAFGGVFACPHPCPP